MSEAVTSPAQQAAVKAYRAMARRLQDEARDLDDSSDEKQRYYPLATAADHKDARRLRYMASIAHRAAFAELHDPEVSR